MYISTVYCYTVLLHSVFELVFQVLLNRFSNYIVLLQVYISTVYCYTGLLHSVFELVFQVLLNRFGNYIFSPKYFKNVESTSFAVNSFENLTIHFCFVLKCMFPLFRADMRSTYVFVVISELITQTLWCVWHKNTIQVNDPFKSRKCV